MYVNQLAVSLFVTHCYLIFVSDECSSLQYVCQVFNFQLPASQAFMLVYLSPQFHYYLKLGCENISLFSFLWYIKNVSLRPYINQLKYQNVITFFSTSNY